jgi:hypothetical protein
MNEMKQVALTSPYQSQKDMAKQRLDAIQEEYKAIFGEYSAEHVLEDNTIQHVRVNEIIAILNKVLKPGKDKGSSQAIIDTKDFKLAAEEIVKLFNE